MNEEATYRERWIAGIRSQIGVRYVPNGRTPYNGLDCSGLIVTGAKLAGLKLHEVSDYSIGGQDISKLLLHYLAQSFDRVERKPRLGDVMLFNIGGTACHCAVMHEEGRFVHAHHQDNVCERKLDRKWKRRIHSVWELRGMN